MPQFPPLKSPDNEEVHEIENDTSDTKEARFSDLTKRLLLVTRDDLREQEKKWREAKP